MSCPASRIVPEVGVSSPATIRRVVVLPQPEGPRSAKKEPRGTSRSRSWTAVNAPKDLVTARSRSPSNPSPGSDSAAESPGLAPEPAWDAGPAPPVSATCDIGPLSFVLGRLPIVERHEVERHREGLVVGEDQLVVDQRRVDLLHRLLGTVDRADVVDPGGELRGDLGLVVVVDPLLGVRLVDRAVRDQHVVAPQR